VKKLTPSPGGWLFKEEPDHYNYADLERDGETLWTGVANALARQNLRKVQKGDRILYYHTGKEKAVVGEMRAVSGPEPDPEAGDPKAVAVRVKPAKRWAHPVILQRIKADPLLATWDLIRLPRLSVVAVSPEQWQRLEELAAADTG
jgi:predicted RNA-binding protein with PUA-like domain